MIARTAPALALTIAALGIAIYAVMDALMKGLSIQSGAYSAVLWRSVAGAGIAGSVFVARGRRWPKRNAVKLHVARGLVAGLSVLLFFWGLARVPMARAVALTFLAPLIAVFLAGLVLGETIRRGAILGSLVATAGVLVIAAGEVQTQASADSVLGTIAIVVASFLYAGSLILLRRQAQLADPLEVALFTSLVIGLVLLAGAPWFSAWPDWPQTPAIGAAAFLGTISAMLMAWAYRRAEAQLLATVEYTAFVWAAVLGWLVFGERVSRFTLGGTVLIVAGCAAAVSRMGPAPLTEAAA